MLKVQQQQDKFQALRKAIINIFNEHESFNYQNFWLLVNQEGLDLDYTINNWKAVVSLLVSEGILERKANDLARTLGCLPGQYWEQDYFFTIAF